MKRAILALLALASFSFGRPAAAQTSSFSGTFHNTNGSVFNGRLVVQLPKNGVQNSCTALSTVVPNTPVYISIVNGSASGALISQDCMNLFVPYRVLLQDSRNNVIATYYWYVRPR